MKEPITKLQAIHLDLVPITTSYREAEYHMLDKAVKQLDAKGIHNEVVKVGGGLQLWRTKEGFRKGIEDTRSMTRSLTPSPRLI